MAFSNIRMTGAWTFRSTPFISFSIFFAVAWRHHLNFSIRKICNIHKCINGVLLKKFRMKSPHLRIILKPYVTILPKINIWKQRLRSSKSVTLPHVRTMANYHNLTKSFCSECYNIWNFQIYRWREVTAHTKPYCCSIILIQWIVTSKVGI